MDNNLIIKEMRKRRKMFPWYKAFCSKYSEKFLDSDKSESLNFLLQNIDNEVKNLILEENMKKAPDVFNLLNTIFLHFWWQIRWKSLKMWTKYWKKVDIYDITATDMQEECCVKLLHSLIQVAIFLSNGCPNSDYIDRVLTIIKLVPGSLDISYDALLLLNNLKKKYMPIYCIILKHILFGEVFETVKMPAAYIKVILLFRRLLKYTKDEKEKELIKFLANKLKPPIDMISWLLSLNIGCVKKLNVENLTQDLLSRPFPDEFLRKLTEALKKNEHFCQNATQVVTTAENEPLQTLSNDDFACENLFLKKKEDSLNIEEIELQKEAFMNTNSSTFNRKGTEIMKTLKEKPIEKEEVLDNLSQKNISRKRKNKKDKNDLIGNNAKKKLKNMSSVETNVDCKKPHKNEKKSIKDGEINYTKCTIIGDENEDQSSSLAMKKDSAETLNTEFNISKIIKTHEKKKKSKKHKKKRSKKKSEARKKHTSFAPESLSQNLNKFQTESSEICNNENEIQKQVNDSITKNEQLHDKNLLIVNDDKNFNESQSQISITNERNEESKEKSKSRKKKLFNSEVDYYNNTREKGLTKNPSASKSFQNQITHLKDLKQGNDITGVSKTVKNNELHTDIDNTTSKMNENEEKLMKLTTAGFKNGAISIKFDDMSNSDVTKKLSASIRKQFQNSAMSSDISISDLLKITPIKIYRNNNVFNIKDYEQSASKNKNSRQSTNSSKYDSDSNTSEKGNNLVVNKRQKIYGSQNFSIKSFSQSIEKNTENKLLNASKKILQRTATTTYEHFSSPSLFDQEITFNSTENILMSQSSSEDKMQSYKQNFETNSNDTSIDTPCDRNSLNLEIQESNMLSLVTESCETQKLDNEYDIQQPSQSYETNSHIAISYAQHDGNLINQESGILTLATESGQTHSTDSEFNMHGYKQDYETDLNSQHSNTLAVVTESSKIHSISSIFQHTLADIRNNASPDFSEDRNSQASNLTNSCVNLGNSVEINAINSHLQNIELPCVITKNTENFCSKSPSQEILSQLTEENTNSIKSHYNTIASPQFPFSKNVNQNEIQNSIFENSCQIQNQAGRNENDILFNSANHHEKETFLQNAKNTLNSTNNFSRTLTDSMQSSNNNNNKPDSTILGTTCKDSSTCIIDCKIINNHDTSNNFGALGISSVQVIINLNNKNNDSTVSNNKIVANFDFQSKSKSVTSLSTDPNTSHHIPLNDNFSSCRNVPSLEVPYMGAANSNKSSSKNVYQFSENNVIPNCNNDQNCLNYFNINSIGNYHADTIPSTSQLLSNDTLEKNPSQDTDIQPAYISNNETSRDLNLNNTNLNNSCSLKPSVFEELSIVNANSNDHLPNILKHVNDEHHSKNLKSLNLSNVKSLHDQTRLSPSLINSNPCSSYRASTEIYSDFSDDVVTVSTLTNISDNEFNCSDLENSENENRFFNPSKSPKEIMSLPSFESTFQRRMVKQSIPENVEELLTGNNNYSNISTKVACNEYSVSNKDTSKSVYKETYNNTKVKKRMGIKNSSYSEVQNHTYSLRPRKSLQKPGKFLNL